MRRLMDDATRAERGEVISSRLAPARVTRQLYFGVQPRKTLVAIQLGLTPVSNSDKRFVVRSLHHESGTSTANYRALSHGRSPDPLHCITEWGIAASKPGARRNSLTRCAFAQRWRHLHPLPQLKRTVALYDGLPQGRRAVKETQRLAEWLVEHRSEEIPERIIHEAKQALLNYVAAALSGCRHEAVDIAVKTVLP